jgi:hypothetical protein
MTHPPAPTTQFLPLAVLLAIWATVPESAASTRRRHDDAPAGIPARLRAIPAEDQRGGGGGSGSLLFRGENVPGTEPPQKITRLVFWFSPPVVAHQHLGNISDSVMIGGLK